MNLAFIHVVDILGTFAFAASGAFAAMEKRLDPFGVLIIAFVTAIGGGTVRDILVGNFPVAWLGNITTVLVILAASLVTLFFGTFLRKFDRMLNLFDAMGLGLFTIVGVQMGLEHQLNLAICVMLGMITGCFGGVLRDVLLNNVPLIFRKEIYASASLAGAVAFIALLNLRVDPAISFIAGILSTIIIRLLAVRYKWSLPKVY